MGGIGVQEFFILMFLMLAIIFHRDVKVIGIERKTSWKPILYALYVALGMITVRRTSH